MKPAGTLYSAKLAYGQVVAARESSRTWLQALRLPNWGILLMIVLAAMALALTVIARERTQLRDARASHSQTAQQLKERQAQNEQLKSRVNSLKSDARVAANAAQDNLNRVRSNEIVVPVR